MTQRVVNYTYGTGNPVLPDGSIDVRDGIDNLQSMDVFMNAPEDTYNQRDGEIVRTVAGMNNEFDAQILNMGFTRIGTFAAGATLTNPRQTLLWDVADGGDGQEYGWSGAFPKVVPAASTPSSTGGISVGAWISRFDPELRIQVREALRRSYAEAGYNLAAGSFEAGGTLVNTNDVMLHEATGVAYSYSGALPKVVPPLSSPATTGGISPAGDWVDVGAASLRSNLATPGGAGMIGFEIPGGVPITVANALKRRMSAFAFNGLTPNTGLDVSAQLQAACDAAYAADVDLILEGGTYVVSSGFSIKRQLIPNGYVTFTGSGSGDSEPTTSIYFERQHSNHFMTFNRCKINFSSGTPGEVINIAVVDLFGGIYNNSIISVGSENGPTTFAKVSSLRCNWMISRSLPILKFTNVSKVEVADTMAPEGRIGVEVVCTRGYSCDSVTIDGSDFSSCVTPISIKGHSNARVTNVTLNKSKMLGSTRDSSSANTAGVNIWWAINVNIKDCDIMHVSDGVKLYACLNVKIEGGRISASSNFPCVRAIGCKDVTISTELLNKNGGFAVLAVGPTTTVPAGAAGNQFSSENIYVCKSKIYAKDRGVKFEDTKNGRAYDNETVASDAINAATGLLWFATGCTSCREWGNTYKAPSGIPLLNAVGAQLTSGLPSGALEVTPSPAAASVSAPVINASDAALNLAKSYVVSFSIGTARQIKADAGPTKKTLTQWMVGKTATLAFNGSGFNPSGGELPDMIVNGALLDAFGGEDYWFARSAVVIDEYGHLTTRDFATPTPSSNVGGSISAKQATERAWQTAFFRAPLIVDGTIYDPVSTFLITQQAWSVDISARTCIGQKSDGTFLVLVVDGASGVSGCTMLQAAQKLLSLGCANAFNLDGGGSTTLWYGGSVINTPSDLGGERLIGHMMYV